MPRRRTTLGGKKPLRYDSRSLRLRGLLPGVGFDYADKRCRERGGGGGPGSTLRHDAGRVLGSHQAERLLASGDDLGGHVVFSLAAALVVAHETYDAARPYERFRHQYGKLAEGVHKFSALLKQHHHDNAIVTGFYLDSSVGLPSDDEEEQEEEEETELAEGVEAMDIDS
ncbi:hypothetical protein DL771_011589 [Monosporascus sp. 5C6A]|nr:hypothetical protein DL771_011589 [Monosporascus sp. 5C6A]